jgi:uncharacterized damage-inducible protein DinB
MMKLVTAVIAAGVLLMSAPAFAQTANPITNGARAQFDVVSNFIIRAAEKVPEEDYPFRATPEVRRMSELFGHIADAFFAMCSTASGEKPPRTAIEKSVTGKTNLVAALKEGAAYCQTVYKAMTDQRGLETVPFYFGPTPRSSVLYFAVAHGYEHYGNVVTYMRLRNIVPPSSEPAKPQQQR